MAMDAGRGAAAAWLAKKTATKAKKEKRGPNILEIGTMKWMWKIEKRVVEGRPAA